MNFLWTSEIWVDNDDDIWTINDDISRGLWIPDISIPGRVTFVLNNRQIFLLINNKKYIFNSQNKTNLYQIINKTTKFTAINRNINEIENYLINEKVTIKNRKNIFIMKSKQHIFDLKNKSTYFEGNKKQTNFIALNREQINNKIIS